MAVIGLININTSLFYIETIFANIMTAFSCDEGIELIVDIGVKVS